MPHIGFGNMIDAERIIGIASPSDAIKHTIQRNRSLVVDTTSGRKTKAVIFVDSGHVILSALAPETIVGRSYASH